MWIEKLIDGVVELETPIGPRYIQPNFLERAYLMWTFRNFFSLPQQVLRPWEKRLIDRLRSENRFVVIAKTSSGEAPIIGRVERRSPAQVEVLTMTSSSSSTSTMRNSPLPNSNSMMRNEARRKPAVGSKAAADQGQEAASA